MQARIRDRMIAGSGTALVLASAAGLLMSAFDVSVARIGETALALVDLRPPAPPPPPPPEPVVPRERAKGAPSPPNLRNKATEIVAKPPVIRLPPPVPVVAAPAPNIGMAAQSGASDRSGPGQGAGGRGDGDGGGGDGGEGNGTPPRWVKGRLSFADLPPELRATGWSGTVGVSYAVGVDGRASACRIDHSSGNPVVDAITCRQIEQRFRFRPALDEDDRPVRSVLVENHEWIVEREPEDRR
ncbi:energy transducer TonB [Sphingomonas sp. AP4-R1]|uniref:energy transducer TonB n=1 Tax=Sphingomonas sp. AP4-R1 TaxID=2735134 RepID=UPI001493325A|nr:energy transducer TonB [Sphingomonas sp. AP4-R1]QJU57957.1 energy transducer TonB [Sphingomonas sp. AP4-R1]